MKRDAFDPLVMEAGIRFHDWSEAARPVLHRIFRDYPQQLSGLQYRADNPQSDESGFSVVTLTTNQNGEYSRKYFDDVYKEEKQGTSWSLSVPDEIIYHLKKVYDHSPFPRVDNTRRNSLLENLKNRTGVNVKKEIKEGVRYVRETRENNLLRTRIETEERLFGKPGTLKHLFFKLIGL